ncbi:MAG: LCP family protein, partial [Chloroflexi bacterium]|nr:LCP family protein [Chloroflexota bacterium]
SPYPSPGASAQPTFAFPPLNLYTPTPIPIPTRHLVIPANPTPRPTPELAPAAPFPVTCDGPGRMHILLIGLDSRATRYDRPARADAIGVLGLNFTDRSAQFLSIPRDLWVQLNDDPSQPDPYYEQRINTAYAQGEARKYPGGGPGMLAAAVAHNFGLRIDRIVVINFASFERAVDAIGGIDINVARAIHDPLYPTDEGGTMVVDIPAGPVHMDGATALIYARTRHQDSDFNRMSRQQEVLMAIRDKVLSPQVLPYLPALAQVAFTTVRTDLSPGDLGLLGCVGPQIDRNNILRLIIDSRLTTPYTTPDGAQVLEPQMDKILPLLEAFNSGE